MGRSSSARGRRIPAWALLAAAVAALTAAKPLEAHRLDEYLQAAQVSVSTGRIVVDLYLTPGTEVAPAVIGAIDKSKDAVFSAEEQREYAAAIIGRLSVRLDYVSIPLALEVYEYPELASLSAGVGSIHLRAAARVAGVPEGAHYLQFDNGFRPPGGIYMANAMLPDTSEIKILDQERNFRQSQLGIRFQVEPGSKGLARAVWIGVWFVGVLVVIGLADRSFRSFASAKRDSRAV